MYKCGVFPGKFLPPHRGHLASIINAATQCDMLYVVVSDNENATAKICSESHIDVMYLRDRVRWLSQELQGYDHIRVIGLDETNIPEYPYGWEEWSLLLTKTVPERFDAIFGGEPSYEKEGYTKYFPQCNYVLYDYNRTRYPISATEIRNSPYKYWDYILGAARPFFAKKVLITGTESCGKTTMTKYLAKMFHTSWSEEVGRYYSAKYLGGNENVFTIKDFERIAYQQYEADMDALRNANRVVFYDTDALVTQYYLGLYLGATSPLIDLYIEPKRYDAVLMFTPDVRWVDDGLRWNSETSRRWNLHEKLKQMYVDKGFRNIFTISGNYNERLQESISIIDGLLS